MVLAGCEAVEHRGRELLGKTCHQRAAEFACAVREAAVTQRVVGDKNLDGELCIIVVGCPSAAEQGSGTHTCHPQPQFDGDTHRGCRVARGFRGIDAGSCRAQGEDCAAEIVKRLARRVLVFNGDSSVMRTTPRRPCSPPFGHVAGVGRQTRPEAGHADQHVGLVVLTERLLDNRSSSASPAEVELLAA